jgi:transposase
MKLEEKKELIKKFNISKEKGNEMIKDFSDDAWETFKELRIGDHRWITEEEMLSNYHNCDCD